MKENYYIIVEHCYPTGQKECQEQVQEPETHSFPQSGVPPKY